MSTLYVNESNTQVCTIEHHFSLTPKYTPVRYLQSNGFTVGVFTFQNDFLTSWIVITSSDWRMRSEQATARERVEKTQKEENKH